MIPELNDRPRTMFPMYVFVLGGIFVITPFGIIGFSLIMCLCVA